MGHGASWHEQEVLRRRKEGSEQADSLWNGRRRQPKDPQGPEEQQASRLYAALDVGQDAAAVATVRVVAHPRA